MLELLDDFVSRIVAEEMWLTDCMICTEPSSF